MRSRTAFFLHSRATALIALWFLLGGGFRLGLDASAQNLALQAAGAHAQSWEPGVQVVPEHEPSRVNDGSVRTYWTAQSVNLPADIGVEWSVPQKVSAVVVRYVDGRMVPSPGVARTQESTELQYWADGKWATVEHQIYGEETSGVRYTFEPVNTTRIRLLFVEPPDPESRRFPDLLGIYVSELEVYSEAPFQPISSPAGTIGPMVKNSYMDHPNYNEALGGDANSDRVGPTIVEPKQPKIFRDTLRPTLIVTETKWAQQRAAVQEQGPHEFRLSNGFLELAISANGSLKENRLTNLVTGEQVSLPSSKTFLIKTSEGELSPDQFRVSDVNTSESTRDVARLRVHLTSRDGDVAVHYELGKEDHFFHKWLTVTNKTTREMKAMDVTLSSLGMPRTLNLVAGPELTYPIYRMGKGGFFSCLETVYWDHVGDTLTYYPAATILPGKSVDTEKAVVGIYENRGEQIGGWDLGIREWITEYHAHVSPISEGWPDVYSEGWAGNFGLREMLDFPQRAEKRFEVAQKIGIKYMDTYEPLQVALAQPDTVIKRWVDLATRHGVGTGFWYDWGSNANWGGPPVAPSPCKLSPESQGRRAAAVALVKKYQLKAMHWGDFLEIWPCDGTQPGKLTGKYSIYAQGQQALQFGRELHDASPGIMLGADGGMTNPQYVRYADSRSYGVIVGGQNAYGYDHYPAVSADIHTDRLYGELNRNYFWDLHTLYLRPSFRLLNIVDHYAHDQTFNHDRAGFRYSLLSGLAMSAQVTFNDIPPEMPDTESEFANKWLSWAKANKEYFKEVDRLFDRSVHHADQWRGDLGSLDGFAHIRSDRGFVFLINSDAVPETAELELKLDGADSAQFRVSDVYPGSADVKGPHHGNYVQGGKLTVTVPAKQIRILWIAPAASASEKATPPQEASDPQVPSRYVGKWTRVSSTPDTVTLKATFKYPEGRASDLSRSVADSVWSKEPWAYDKAYLVFQVQDETETSMANFVPNDLLNVSKTSTGGTSDFGQTGGASAGGVKVNGVYKTLHSFQVVPGLRGGKEGFTRCFFVDLDGEVKPGEDNDVEIVLPIQRGLVFSGAYLDLPDQMPLSLPAEHPAP